MTLTSLCWTTNPLTSMAALVLASFALNAPHRSLSKMSSYQSPSLVLEALPFSSVLCESGFLSVVSK